MITAAVALAEWLGVSQLVIGLTLVAAGTSLPEAVTSIVAAARSERDLAVGNVVGSNIFNLTCVLGLTAICSANGVPVSPAALHWDIPVMVAVSLICLPVLATGRRVSRGEGALLWLAFVGYMGILLINGTRH